MARLGKAVFTGDWGKVASILGSLSVQFPAAMESALQEEGQFYRRKIIEGITSQAPGGKAFKPLSPVTLAIRQATGFNGTKALIRHGDLRGSITSSSAGKGAVFVGVLYTARGPDGRQLADIAKINEYGATIRAVLTKARLRFLKGVLRHARGTGSSGGGEQGGMSVIRIPPRPFLQPIFDMYSGMRGGLRMQARVAKKLGGMLGVINHPDLGGRSPLTIPGRLLGGKGAAMMNRAVMKSAKGGRSAYTKSIRSAFKASKPSASRVAKKPKWVSRKRRSVKTSSKKLPPQLKGYWAKRLARERTARGPKPKAVKKRSQLKLKGMTGTLKPRSKQLSLFDKGAAKPRTAKPSALPKMGKAAGGKKTPRSTQMSFKFADKAPKKGQMSFKFPTPSKAKTRKVKPKQLSLLSATKAAKKESAQMKLALPGKARRKKGTAPVKVSKVKVTKVKQKKARSTQLSMKLTPTKPRKPSVRKPKQKGFGF